MRLALLPVAMCLFVGTALAADPATMPAVTDPRSIQLKPEEMAWWRDAKFGMFIHWGLYAIPAEGEWIMHNNKIPADEYRKFADQFNPQKYDPAIWAAAAKDAGMKYMVLTARHHDGFALWNSPSSFQQFDAPRSAARRDLIAPYVKAARDAGLRVGLYYSPMDWRFPGYFDPVGQADNAALMKKQCWGQIEELVTAYGRIDILWYDGGWLAHKGSDADAAPFWESDKLNLLVRRHQPGAVISPRSGWLGDFAIEEGGSAVRGAIRPGPWEKCLNLNNTAWGFTTRQSLLSRERVIEMLVDVLVRGGNLLLNVGPDKDGQIPQAHIDRLREVGRWTTQYADAIYGTRAGPWQPVDGRYGAVYRDKTLYLHVLNWSPPAARGETPPRPALPPQTLTLPPLRQKITAVRVLTGDGTATFTQSDTAVTVTLPPDKHDPLDTIIALECDAPVGG